MHVPPGAKSEDGEWQALERMKLMAKSHQLHPLGSFYKSIIDEIKKYHS